MGSGLRPDWKAVDMHTTAWRQVILEVGRDYEKPIQDYRDSNEHNIINNACYDDL